MSEYYSPEQAAQHATQWCAKHPAWKRICDIPDCNVYYVQWDELSATQKKRWGSAYAYNEFATKRKKVKIGVVTGKGEFFEDAVDVPFGHNTMMVIRVGTKAPVDSDQNTIA